MKCNWRNSLGQYCGYHDELGERREANDSEKKRSLSMYGRVWPSLGPFDAQGSRYDYIIAKMTEDVWESNPDYCEAAPVHESIHYRKKRRKDELRHRHAAGRYR